MSTPHAYRRIDRDPTSGDERRWETPLTEQGQIVSRSYAGPLTWSDGDSTYRPRWLRVTDAATGRVDYYTRAWVVCPDCGRMFDVDGALPDHHRGTGNWTCPATKER